LLQRVLDAYGGLEALSRVVAIHQTGTVHPLMRNLGQVGEVVRVLAPPERLRVEIAYGEGNREVRVLDGSQGWRDGVSVSGPQLDSMRIQAARLSLPLLLHRSAGELVDRGTVDHQGRKLQILELPLAGGVGLTLEIDAESARIVATTGRLSMGPETSIEFRTTYDDFRRVDGLLFAFREGNYVAGNHTADTRLEKVEVLDAPPRIRD